jgi:excisionase family DNA binding protein
MASTRYQLLSVAEAAEQLNRKRWFIYGQIYSGKLPYHRIGGQLAVAQADLDNYVSKSRIAAKGERKTRKPAPMEAAKP